MGWRWKNRALNPERADIRRLAMSSAYVWMLSLGAKVCLSPKIRRAVAGGKPGSVNALRFGPPLFQNRLWARRRIQCALNLPTGLRAAKKRRAVSVKGEEIRCPRFHGDDAVEICT